MIIHICRQNNFSFGEVFRRFLILLVILLIFGCLFNIFSDFIIIIHVMANLGLFTERLLFHLRSHG